MKFVTTARASVTLFSCCAIPIALTSCGAETEKVTFEFGMNRGETNALFLATASKPEIIARAHAELTKPEADRGLHINGTIAEGNEGNLDWSWHFVDDEWDLAEKSVELCDGSTTGC